MRRKGHPALGAGGGDRRAQLGVFGAEKRTHEAALGGHAHQDRRLFCRAATDAADELQEQLFQKRKLLFDKSGKASAADLDRILKIVDAIVGDAGAEGNEG